MTFTSWLRSSVLFITYLPLSTCIVIISSIVAYFLIPVLLGGRRKNWKNAPPGPTGWPLLGILPNLSERLHEDFLGLSKIYGPIFSVNLGLKPAIVVTSPEMAQEVLKVKESSICSRNITETIRVISYDAMSIIFAPYGALWKVLRRVLITELLSSKAFEQFEPLRRREVHGLLKYFYRISITKTQINIAEEAFVALANLVSNVVCSKSLFDNTNEEGKQMKMAFWELIKVIGAPNIADLIPVLRPFDPQGLKRKILKVFKRLDVFYEKLIEERLEERRMGIQKKGLGKKDMLDVLLDYRGTSDQLDQLPKNTIKGMLSEMFVAGTETTSSTVEWGMSEVLRNHSVYKKLISELDQVVGKNRFVVESDIPDLPYLQAVVKEVFRLHPGVPLIIPRRSDEEFEVGGYHIPKQCIVYVNVWGIARDPKVWEDPYEFKPERFIGSSVDVKGQDFNLLPFGTGRRSCVGWPLAHRMVHFYLAALLHAFEWDCPSQVLHDRCERVGMTLQKDKSLLGTPRARLPDSVYQN